MNLSVKTTLRKKLSVTIEAAKIRDDQVDHIVLAGPPGLGKLH